MKSGDAADRADGSLTRISHGDNENHNHAGGGRQISTGWFSIIFQSLERQWAQGVFSLWFVCTQDVSRAWISEKVSAYRNPA